MPEDTIENMSSRELWTLHLEVNAVLSEKLAAQKDEIERRLRLLQLTNPDRRSKRRSLQMFDRIDTAAAPVQ